jgi:hypothetical protein
MNEVIFSFILNRMIEEEAESIKDILGPLKDEHWRASRAFVGEFKGVVEEFCRRFVHRASLFGQYRSDPDMLKTSSKKRVRPPPMDCRESDFNLAWQTLEQDSK